MQIPVSNLTFDHDLSVHSNGTTFWSGKFRDAEARVITVDGIRVPPEGLDLVLSVRGTLSTIDPAEASIFGTTKASLKIGDVTVNRSVSSLRFDRKPRSPAHGRDILPIPAYRRNSASARPSTVRGHSTIGMRLMIIIDDGSTDDTFLHNARRG